MSSFIVLYTELCRSGQLFYVCTLQTGHLRNIVSSVLCIELAAEVDELDQLLEAANPNNIEQNGKYINYLFKYIFYCIFWLLYITCFSNFTNRNECVL